MAAKLFPYADMFKWMSYGNGTFFWGGGVGVVGARAYCFMPN